VEVERPAELVAEPVADPAAESAVESEVVIPPDTTPDATPDATPLERATLRRRTPSAPMVRVPSGSFPRVISGEFRALPRAYAGKRRSSSGGGSAAMSAHAAAHAAARATVSAAASTPDVSSIDASDVSPGRQGDPSSIGVESTGSITSAESADIVGRDIPTATAVLEPPAPVDRGARQDVVSSSEPARARDHARGARVDGAAAGREPDDGGAADGARGIATVLAVFTLVVIAALLFSVLVR
jgi:hypothetical protein